MLVADDDVRTRAMVLEALQSSDDFELCAEVMDADSAVAAAQHYRPDICLLDIRIPGGGIAVTAHITATLPTTAVVVLTESRHDDDLFDALRAGARGYLLKGLAGDEVIESLHRVMEGEAPIPGCLVARLVEEFRDRERRRVRLPQGGTVLLTPREWDVLELLGSGASTSEIAQRLFVSTTTVRSHVSSILRKLRVTDRQAVVRLLRNGDPVGPTSG